MIRWFYLTALSLAVMACTSSAGRSQEAAVPPVNPVDSLLAIFSGQEAAPRQKVAELARSYGEYRLSDEDKTRLAEGFAGISAAKGEIRDYLVPALEEELRPCETFADVCGRLQLPGE